MDQTKKISLREQSTGTVGPEIFESCIQIRCRTFLSTQYHQDFIIRSNGTRKTFLLLSYGSQHSINAWLATKDLRVVTVAGIKRTSSQMARSVTVCANEVLLIGISSPGSISKSVWYQNGVAFLLAVPGEKMKK